MKKLVILLAMLMLAVPAFCEETTDKPTQDVVIKNSYVTRVKVQKDDELINQNINIEKCWFLWVTVQKQIPGEQKAEQPTE